MATVTFPNSYLPTNSQPWGRVVEKQLVDLNLLVTSNEINNAARDKQLLASLNRTNIAVNNAQTALDNILSVEEAVYYPGTNQINGANIHANTIAANAISAGTLTGFTIQTAYSGARVLIGGSDQTNIKFYDSSEVITGEIVASSSVFNVRNVRGGNGTWGSGARSSLELGLGSATIYLNNGSFAASLTMGVTQSVFSTSVEAYGFSSGFGGISTTGSITSGNGISTTSGSVVISNPGGVAGSNYLSVPDTYARNVQSGRIVYVASNGTYNSASSSERYKQDIQPYQIDIDKLMQLEPVSFRYKQAVSELGNDADVAHGFIAEQADSIGLTEFVDYELDEDGNLRPDNFRYIDFTAALFGVIKQLNSRIEALENK